MAYRARKLVRRRRGLVVASSLVTAAVLAGLVVSTLLYFQSEGSRREADRHRTEAQRRAYVANITLANVNIQAGRLSGANGRLKLTEPSLRGWEWYHLLLETDSSLVRLNAYGPVRALQFSHDGRRVFGYDPQTVHVRDAESYRPLGAYGGFTDILAVSPGGHRVVSKRPNSDKDFSLEVLNVESRRLDASLRDLTAEASTAAFSPDGTRVAAGSKDGTTRIWDASSGRLLMTLKRAPYPIGAIAFSPDGTTLACPSGDVVRLWNTRTGTIARELRASAAVGYAALAYSPDGSRLAAESSAMSDYGVRVWDLGSNTAPLILRGHAGRISAVAFSQDGATLASASSDRTVRLWNLAGNALSATFAAGESELGAVAFNPTGRRLWSGSASAEIKVWDTSMDGAFSTLRRQSYVLWDRGGLEFSPDGRLLVSVEDYNVRVWNVTTKSPGKLLSGHTRRVSSVAFDARGTRVVSGPARPRRRSGISSPAASD